MTIGHEVSVIPQPATGSKFKERVRIERELEILNAAREVFSERGFEKTSIDDIAERVGIGKGTVYLHFASKEEILVAIMQRANEQLVVRCRRLADAQEAMLAKLQVIMRELVNHRFTDERWMDVIASALPHFLGKKHHLGASHALRVLIAETLATAQRQGVVDPRIHPHLAATAMLTLVFLCPLVEDSHPSKKELLECATQLYFHGITTEVKV